MLVDARVEVSLKPSDKLFVYKAGFMNFSDFDFSRLVNSRLKKRESRFLAFEFLSQNHFTNYFENGEQVVTNDLGNVGFLGMTVQAYTQARNIYEGHLMQGERLENHDALPFGSNAEALKLALTQLAPLKLPIGTVPNHCLHSQGFLLHQAPHRHSA